LLKEELSGASKELSGAIKEIDSLKKYKDGLRCFCNRSAECLWCEKGWLSRAKIQKRDMELNYGGQIQSQASVYGMQ
jgi:hypothetical protein